MKKVLKGDHTLAEAANLLGMQRPTSHTKVGNGLTHPVMKTGSICQRRCSPDSIAQLAEISRLRREGVEPNAAVARVKRGGDTNEDLEHSTHEVRAAMDQRF